MCGAVSLLVGRLLCVIVCVPFPPLQAIEDRRVRRLAAVEGVLSEAASRLDGALLASLMRPAVALAVDSHAPGLAEFRVVGANYDGLAACVANMFPVAVRR